MEETDETLWAIAQPLVVHAVRESGGEMIPVFDEEDEFIWSVLDAQANLVGGQLIVTFDVQVEGEEDSLILTMSLLEMGEQLSATASWSDESILPQQTIHDIVATSSLGQCEPPLSPVVVNAELSLVALSRLFCKCDNDLGSGCKQDDCDYIRPCPNPPPSGIHSCAWTYAF